VVRPPHRLPAARNHRRLAVATRHSAPLGRHRPQSLWELDPSKERACVFSAPHTTDPPRWRATKDSQFYARHEPPCVGDILLRREPALNTIGVTADGLAIADSIHREISNALTTVRDEAEHARAALARRRRPQPTRSPARRPTPQPMEQVAAGSPPVPTPKPGALTCETCSLPLDPMLAQIGRHILCLPAPRPRAMQALRGAHEHRARGAGQHRWASAGNP
jgi:hypothetical protein